MSSIGFLWCFACQSVASSPDSNERCHQEAEGIRRLYKGNRQDATEDAIWRGESIRRLFFSPFCSSEILKVDQIWQQHWASRSDLINAISSFAFKKNTVAYRNKNKLLWSLSHSIPKYDLHPSTFQHNPLFHCALVLVCLPCNCRLPLFCGPLVSVWSPCMPSYCLNQNTDTG